MKRWIETAIAQREAGFECPFVVTLTGNGRVVGSTRYLDIAEAHKGVEIGWTWYTPEVWGTAVNAEAKYLLLRHAFESWSALRVCLKTDARNLHSQAAIRKLGAIYEGTLRKHRVMPDGHQRSSVYFSIVDEEWPDVKLRLEERLARYEGAPTRHNL